MKTGKAILCMLVMCSSVCIAAGDLGIVGLEGTQFVVDGKPVVFVGVNHYQSIMQEMGDFATSNSTRTESTEQLFKAAAENGLKVIRIIMYNLGDAKLPDPGGAPKASVESGGKLTAGEYVYRYTAGNLSGPEGRLKLGQTLPSPAVKVTVGKGKKVRLVMPSVKYAYRYLVYRKKAAEPEGSERLVKMVSARVGEDAVFVDDGSEQLKDTKAPTSNTTMNNPRTMWPTRYSKPFQTGLGNWNEDKFQAMDRTLLLARKYGIRLIPVLADQHENNTGGVTDYSRAAGDLKHSKFFTDPWIRARFKEWIYKLVTRVNSVSGRSYRDDGAIFSWELINEPYDTGGGGNLRAWAREMASHIKELDGNHMVCLGDDGSFWAQETEYEDKDLSPKNISASHSFQMTQNMPQIDFLTWHAYPQNRGFVFMFGGHEHGRSGPTAVHGPLNPKRLRGEFQRRANYAAVFNKPIFIGEWGLNWKGDDLAGWVRNTLANMRKVRPQWKLGDNLLKAGVRESEGVLYEAGAGVEAGADYWVDAKFLNRTDKDGALVVRGTGGTGPEWTELARIPMPRGDYWNAANCLSAGYLKINAGQNNRIKVTVECSGSGKFRLIDVELRKFTRAGSEEGDNVFGGIAFWTWGPVGQGLMPSNKVFTGELKRYRDKYE